MSDIQPGLAGLSNTLREAMTEISRELTVRDHVYPKLVVAGKLTQNEADRRRRALRCGLYYLETLAQEQHAASHTTGERV